VYLIDFFFANKYKSHTLKNPNTNNAKTTKMFRFALFTSQHCINLSSSLENLRRWFMIYTNQVLRNSQRKKKHLAQSNSRTQCKIYVANELLNLFSFSTNMPYSALIFGHFYILVICYINKVL
jgi:hypothetical protein